MSEKVKLTREQAESLRKAVGRYGEDLTVIRHAERYFHEEYGQNLFELTTAEVAKALYIGYEVEETFEVGDWVVRTVEGIRNKGLYEEGRVFKIYAIEDSLNCAVFCEEMGGHSEDSIRHATPEEIAEEKQRRWWAKHGREVWELRKGDVIKKLCSPFEFEAWEITDIDDHYIYAKDSRMIHPKTTKMDANYKVICFAEDRKDIDGGDNE